MQLVVGRIGRAARRPGRGHRRGAHRRARAAVRPRRRARHRPGLRGAAAPSSPAACTAAACCSASRAYATAPAAEALRGTLLVAEVDPDELPEDPDEFYDHQLIGPRRGHAGRRRGRRGHRDARTCRRRTCSSWSGPTAARSMCRSSRRSSPRSTSRSSGVIDPPPGLIDDRAEIVCLDADEGGRGSALTCARRHHDLPRVPRPARRLPRRQGPRARHARHPPARAPRQWTHDVHRTVDDTPYGGGPGMVMKPEPWGDALDDVLADGYETGPRPRPRRAHPQRAPLHPGARRRARPSARGWSSRPRATRASTAASSTSTRPGCRSTRSPSATTCSPAERPRCSSIIEAVARLLPGVLGNAAVAPGRLLRARRDGQPPRRARLHQAPRVARTGHPRDPAQRPPRQDRALAPGRGAAPHHPQRPDLVERCDPSVFDKKDREMLSILGWRPGPDGRFGRDPEAVEE